MIEAVWHESRNLGWNRIRNPDDVYPTCPQEWQT